MRLQITSCADLLTLPAQTFKNNISRNKGKQYYCFYICIPGGKKCDSAHVGDCLVSGIRRASAHTFHNKNCNSGLITGREERALLIAGSRARAWGLMCGVHPGIRVAAIINFPMSCLISAAIQVANFTYRRAVNSVNTEWN